MPLITRVHVKTVSFLLALSSVARADGLIWHAPATCPTVDDVRARIARRLDGEVGFGEIDVQIARAGTGLMATLAVGGTTRTLTAERCDELADAVAVIVARLASDARRARLAEVPSGDPMLGITLAVPQEAPAAITHPPSAPHWDGGLRALGLSGVGITPRLGLGGELAGFVRRDRAFAEAGYARWAEGTTYATAALRTRVDIGVQMLGVRAGWASRRMPLRGWLGLEVGAMSGHGVALGGSTRWTAITSGFGVGWPIARRVHLVGGVEVAVPLERARFVLSDGSEIFEPSPASARCSLGLEVALR